MLTTDDGTKYLFGASDDGIEKAIETTITTETISGFIENSWYLVEIITPNKKRILFNYDKENYSFFTAPIVSKYTRLTPIGYYSQPFDQTQELHTLSSAKLKSIQFDNGEIQLESTLKRYDLDGAGALTSVRILSKAGNILNELKKYNFYYSYLSSSGTISNDALSAAGVNMNDKNINADYYLKLDSVVEISNNIRTPAYSFDYSNRSLPGRFSASTDHWGYFNGKSNGTNKLPKTYYLVYDGSQPTYTYDNSGADKTPDPGFAEASSLLRIKFPTGGTTSFTYEGNMADSRVSVHPLYSINGNTITPITTVVDKSATCSFYKSEETTSPQDTSEVQEVVINGDNTKVSFYVQLRGVSTTFFPYCFYLHFYRTSDNTGGIYTVDHISGNTYIASATLPSGTYKFYFTKSNGPSCSSIDYIVMYGYAKWSELETTSNPDSTRNIDVGGLRVKKIDSYDNVTESHLTKEYYYTNFEDGSVSSGSVVNFPSYLFNVIGRQNYANITGMESNYSAIYQTTSSYPLQTTSGGTAGYANVMEKSSSNSPGDNGYSKYYYTSPKDFPDSIYDAKKYGRNFMPSGYSTSFLPPFMMRLPLSAFPSFGSVDWRRGLLKKSETYVRVDTGYRVQSIVENNYAVSPATGLEKSTMALKYYRLQPDLISDYPLVTQPSVFVCNLYNTPSEFQYLESTSETTFDNNNRVLISYTGYRYNSATNLLATSKMHVNSEKDTVINNYFYPTDKANINMAYSLTPAFSLALDSMIKRNILSPVILDNTYKGSKSLSSILSCYNLFGGNPQKQSVFQKILEGDFEKRIEFNSYDGFGNILEQQKFQDSRAVYLWGYSSQYPVAKITGSSLLVVMGIPSIDTSLLNVGTNIQRQSQLALIRNYFSLTPGVQVSTYTYQPLVGMTSETDPTGRTTFYEYDAFGRLTLVKDEDGNILKRICYNYAGQVTDCGSGRPAASSTQWVATGTTRCVKDGSNNNTGYQEREERDNNTGSATYNQVRWVNMGSSTSSCPLPNNGAYWQATGTTRCVKDGSNNNTGIQEREERDQNTTSATYNQTRWVSTGTNTTACPLPSGGSPDWQVTGTTRCVKDGSNNNTGTQEREERDQSTSSATYNQTRWVSTGTNTTACPLPNGGANWQATGNTRCVKDGSNNNTGTQEREERDQSTSSATYNQTRWVSTGENTTACPLSAPNWQATGNTRCKKNGALENTGIQQGEERDNNPVSTSYNEIRWVDIGENTTTCPIPTTVPNWQPTGDVRCEAVDNINTGNQERKELDMSPGSSTYMYERWVSTGVNATACPLNFRTVSYINKSDVTFTVAFTNVSSNQTYTRTANPVYTMYIPLMNDLPPGTYNITATPVSGNTPVEFLFAVNDVLNNDYVKMGTSFSIQNVPVTHNAIFRIEPKYTSGFSAASGFSLQGGLNCNGGTQTSLDITVTNQNALISGQSYLIGAIQDCRPHNTKTIATGLMGAEFTVMENGQIYMVCPGAVPAGTTQTFTGLTYQRID